MPPSTLQTPRSAWHCSLQVLCPSGPQGCSGDTLRKFMTPTNESLMAVDAGSPPGMRLSFPSHRLLPNLPRAGPQPSPSGCGLYQGKRASAVSLRGSPCPFLDPCPSFPRQHPPTPCLSRMPSRFPCRGWKPGLPASGPVLASSPLKARVSLLPLPPSSSLSSLAQASHRDGGGGHRGFLSTLISLKLHSPPSSPLSSPRTGHGNPGSTVLLGSVFCVVRMMGAVRISAWRQAPALPPRPSLLGSPHSGTAQP